MKAHRIALAGLLLASHHAVRAHRLDEYLQATFLSVEKDQLRVDVFLTPGHAVLTAILGAIDTDGDDLIQSCRKRALASDGPA